MGVADTNNSNRHQHALSHINISNKKIDSPKQGVFSVREVQDSVSLQTENTLADYYCFVKSLSAARQMIASIFLSFFLYKAERTRISSTSF